MCALCSHSQTYHAPSAHWTIRDSSTSRTASKSSRRYTHPLNPLRFHAIVNTHTHTHTHTHTSDFTGPGRVGSPALSLRHPLQHPGVNSLTANEGARTILLANSRPPVRVGTCCSTSSDTRPRTCCVCKTDDSTRQTDSSTGEWAPGGGAMCVICWVKKKKRKKESLGVLLLRVFYVTKLVWRSVKQSWNSVLRNHADLKVCMRS